MKNKRKSIPAAMLFKKFYCHSCGERLVKNARTRTVRRGDPDYKEYSRIGRTHMIGDVELTEYDFKCPCCERITSYDEQCVIERIQKNIGRQVLSPTEISDHTKKAEEDLKRRKRRTNFIVKAIFIALVVLAVLMSFMFKDFSIKFYF